MDSPDEYEEAIAEELREIHQEHLDALRRAGVAERKREGYKIESTEALRLFQDATGYLTRLRELRYDVENELRYAEYYHVERVIGHLEDFNRILKDIRRDESFENAIRSYTEIEFESVVPGYSVDIDGRSDVIKSTHQNKSFANPRSEKNVPMDGTSVVETFVYPRLVRLTKDVEHSLIGRCSSGKRPDESTTSDQ